MARSTRTPPRRGSRTMLPPTVTLAAWRLRQTWRLLLVMGLGMLAAVTLVCTAPLFSQVTLTAGLRGVLTATPADSQVVLHADAVNLTTEVAAQDNQELGDFMQHYLGSYFASPPQFSIQPHPIHVSSFRPGDQLQLIGDSMQASKAHVKLIQGRLPQTTSDAVELAMTPETVQAINARIGTEFTTNIGFFGSPGPITLSLKLRLVGVITPLPGDPYWHGETFSSAIRGEFTLYKALMSNDGFLTALTRAEGLVALNFLDKPDLLWYYQLDVSRIRMTDIDDLVSRLSAAQTQLTAQYGNTPYLTSAQLFGPPVDAFGNPSTLEKYRDRVSVVQIPVDIIAFQVFCLVLFFVSMMADLLIDRQGEVIALLRSRGASRRQVFGSFVNQSVGLGVLVLVAGPLLAILTTRLVGQATLSPTDQGALNILDGNPFQVGLEQVGWYALAAALGAIIAMVVTIRSSASRDVLEMRRETARTTRRPLWQRLYLDMVAAIIALTGYGISLYVTHAGVLDTRVNLLISAPLALVAPIFLVVAGVLLFLRLFPVLVRLAARFAARRKGAAPMLALAQMARAPRQAMRMVLLLALASSFAIFSLAFTASESQQILAVAANQAGADFSGVTLESTVPNYTVEQESLAQHTADYRQIPGVLSAVLGFATTALPTGGAAPNPIEIRAVDTQNFAQTAIWTNQDSPQSLRSLMSQLTHSHTLGTIPAIVDALAWKELQLDSGTSFSPSFQDAQIPFVAIAEVQHIPTVNDSLDAPGTSDYTPPGGILVDYQKLAALYQDNTQNPLSPNYVWLHTNDNPTMLANVRAALTTGPLQLSTLNDRRAMIADLQRDPLYVNLITVLQLGVIATIPLAVVGNLIASWLNARSRLTSFVILRALGSAPRQIARVLIWEQGIVYAAAILLGVLFGGVLIATVIPSLVFIGVPPGTGQAISSGEFFTIQHVLPTQIVLPLSLGIVFAALIAICVIALWMMARVVSQPSISQTLRLNED
jgi:putative ABC transport system permease protein